MAYGLKASSCHPLTSWTYSSQLMCNHTWIIHCTAQTDIVTLKIVSNEVFYVCLFFSSEIDKMLDRIADDKVCTEELAFILKQTY